MSEALTIGWTQAKAASSRRLYRLALGLNLLLTFILALACLFCPLWVADWLDLPGPIPAGWTRGYGGALILLVMLYLPGWLDPLTIRGSNLVGIPGRLWMGIVWLFIGGGFLWLAAFELLFALLLGVLFWRMWRDDLQSYP